MTYEQWIEAVRKLAGLAYDRLASLYSFRSAFDDGLTPRQAVRDCRSWLQG